jgi:hypothetical protein
MAKEINLSEWNHCLLWFRELCNDYEHCRSCTRVVPMHDSDKCENCKLIRETRNITLSGGHEYMEIVCKKKGVDPLCEGRSEVLVGSPRHLDGLCGYCFEHKPKKRFKAFCESYGVHSKMFYIAQQRDKRKDLR